MFKKILPYLCLLLLVINGGCKAESSQEKTSYSDNYNISVKNKTTVKKNIIFYYDKDNLKYNGYLFLEINKRDKFQIISKITKKHISLQIKSKSASCKTDLILKDIKDVILNVKEYKNNTLILVDNLPHKLFALEYKIDGKIKQQIMFYLISKDAMSSFDIKKYKDEKIID